MTQSSEEEKDENRIDTTVKDMFEEVDSNTIVCRVCVKHLRDTPKGLRNHFKGFTKFKNKQRKKEGRGFMNMLEVNFMYGLLLKRKKKLKKRRSLMKKKHQSC